MFLLSGKHWLEMMIVAKKAWKENLCQEDLWVVCLKANDSWVRNPWSTQRVVKWPPLPSWNALWQLWNKGDLHKNKTPWNEEDWVGASIIPRGQPLEYQGLAGCRLSKCHLNNSFEVILSWTSLRIELKRVWDVIGREWCNWEDLVWRSRLLFTGSTHVTCPLVKPDVIIVTTIMMITSTTVFNHHHGDDQHVVCQSITCRPSRPLLKFPHEAACSAAPVN